MILSPDGAAGAGTQWREEHGVVRRKQERPAHGR
jgi:hypothetical protein